MYRILLLLLPFAVAGCLITGPELDQDLDGVRLRTDDSSYVAVHYQGEGLFAQYGFTLVARFENPSSVPLYLWRCYPESPHPIYGLIPIDPPNQGSGYSHVWACVGHDSPIVVYPGQVRIDSLFISGPFSWKSRPLGALEGVYQLRYDAKHCPDEVKCDLPDIHRRSNHFRIRVEEFQWRPD